MKSKEKQSAIGRRDLIKTLGLGTAAALSGVFGNLSQAQAQQQEKMNKPPVGLPPVKIKRVRAIGVKSAPGGRGSNLVVVKVETTEPGLYGLGCATFTQRAEAVVTAVDRYLNDFCVGRDADNIEDMWQSAYVSSYWRNGPVLNNALSGLDEALWDIKGKRANMPVYQLLGGKCRFAVDTYTSVGGRTAEETAEMCLKQMEAGQRYVRIQLGGYGGVGAVGTKPDFKEAGFGMPGDIYMDDQAYLRAVPKLFEVVRKRCGEEVELCHDIHERCQPLDVINMCRKLEEYRPFFIEDPVSPENTHWWKQLRESTTVPFAMGELFNNINEFLQPMVNHYFDYIRLHVSQIGGITPAMKVARLGEWFNVRTIWHGPGDVSPVGHSAQAHMDLACWNFGLQEGGGDFSDYLRELFPGCCTKKNGYIYVNDNPGLGIDINEKMAAKNPISNDAGNWTVRKRDGTIIRP
ncbi:MAG TPA: enolase C-terminal domain-like protein [Bacteroidales bacterium]|nr:starvation-sensing protein RspA [Bacteroidales bacterium]HRC88521.1 enolase C-terminal domain-like protein [Bacteroidales bacterium]